MLSVTWKQNVCMDAGNLIFEKKFHVHMKNKQKTKNNNTKILEELNCKVTRLTTGVFLVRGQF